MEGEGLFSDLASLHILFFKTYKEDTNILGQHN